MAHMEKQITARQRGWRVETRDAGTCYIPGDDVAPVPDWLKSGVEVRDIESVFATLHSMISDYVEGHNIQCIEVVEGYFGRWSAPGYLDCTAWEFNTSVRELRSELGRD